ncbi:hypothetical protein V6N13_092675 [Hibiscus sabdariffa]|uniref:Uncharacterized protein n=1 Tax=Hibiscus sabdariffa TaxID=183260 RepID=A0ABR2N8G7_9ROSI
MDFQVGVLADSNSKNLTSFVSMEVSKPLHSVSNRLVLYHVLYQMEQSNLKDLIVVVEELKGLKDLMKGHVRQELLFVKLSMCVVPRLKRILTSLWCGHFAYMVIDSIASIKQHTLSKFFLLKHLQELNVIPYEIIEAQQKNMNLPFHILAPQKVRVEGKFDLQVFVQWEGLGKDVATWIRTDESRQPILAWNLEDKVPFPGDDIVRDVTAVTWQ